MFTRPLFNFSPRHLCLFLSAHSSPPSLREPMSLREDWGRLVDEVCNMDSTEPLPEEFVPSEFLPGGCELPADLLHYLRSGANAFEAETADLFQPQTSTEEGFHAAPIISRYGTAGTLRNLVGDRGENPRLPRHEGPNFYEAYRAHAALNAEGGGRNNLTSSASAAAAAGSAGANNILRSIGNGIRINPGFMVPEYHSQRNRKLNFVPLILISASVSSVLQVINIKDFLEDGVYVEPSSRFLNPVTGDMNVEDAPKHITVRPGSFLDADKYRVAYREFRVVNGPKQVKNWNHVCACIVDGNEWQFNHWFPDEVPSLCVSRLFQRVCGFLPYFEEDKPPKALQDWHVTPLKLTRRVVKSHTHIRQASAFWEHLYLFLDTHPLFKLFTVPPDQP
ncbi:hypothetical protein, conserved [Trypanosoma brucei gambiense DAL972]|uniref:Cell division control protein 73 C-terminal domain-containing protein n=1 Tax=Trypanosoma brucei gambiense (strain MHOM/CI/86/DAL972) TaxID=679716 RepID=D0A8M8_TRYB9|nr:hypothetical protein, conserved [Trypanosoma brucei gambiense DAL972]CBH18029.1 hypothetical protein, conserved [Trypanosoma brucei gambiense DAL972]|eukprot:XP_011780293.1 hypothetical protein, conserved [Trypanosoma brucei gambiense DAL972]